mmetsp:Transcript_102333/g.329991  ORF Transcript_102333/g.329991 Transcript_102333/m.329991 type:complete len:316 (+) Transcript_102333:586-1533(+)
MPMVLCSLTPCPRSGCQPASRPRSCGPARVSRPSRPGPHGGSAATQPGPRAGQAEGPTSPASTSGTTAARPRPSWRVRGTRRLGAALPQTLRPQLSGCWRTCPVRPWPARHWLAPPQLAWQGRAQPRAAEAWRAQLHSARPWAVWLLWSTTAWPQASAAAAAQTSWATRRVTLAAPSPSPPALPWQPTSRCGTRQDFWARRSPVCPCRRRCRRPRGHGCLAALAPTLRSAATPAARPPQLPLVAWFEHAWLSGHALMHMQVPSTALRSPALSRPPLHVLAVWNCLRGRSVRFNSPKACLRLWQEESSGRVVQRVG